MANAKKTRKTIKKRTKQQRTARAKPRQFTTEVGTGSRTPVRNIKGLLRRTGKFKGKFRKRPNLTSPITQPTKAVTRRRTTRRRTVSRFAPPIIQTPSRRQFIPPEIVGF